MPPIQQATTDGTLVQAFIPLVFRCAGAADIRIRLMGAKALVALLQPSCLPRLAHCLLLDASPYVLNAASQEPCLPTNLVHGMFLQVLEIMKSEYWPVYDATLLQNMPHLEYLNTISTLLSKMASECFNSSSNICPIIRQTCLACIVAFGSSNNKTNAKWALSNVLEVPSSLDVASMELLIQLQDAFNSKHTSLEFLVKDVLNGNNPELKRLILGLLVKHLNGKGIDFSKYGRLLCYEDVVNLLGEVSSPPYRFNGNGRCLGISSCVPQLIKEIGTSLKRPYQPYSLIGYHASQLLVSMVDAVSWDYQLPKLEENEALPMHLGPLLTVKALTSSDKEGILGLLAGYADPKNLDVHWSIRTEAILAVDRLLSQDRGSVISNLPINVAILRSLIMETDDEVVLIAAKTASKILHEPDKYPQESLPPVILPPFLSNFVATFGEVAIPVVLKLIQEDLLADESGGSEVSTRVFLSEESSSPTSAVELTAMFCPVVKTWIQNASSKERNSRVVEEIRHRGLTEFLGGSASEMNYSRSGEVKALRRTVAHLPGIRDLIFTLANGGREYIVSMRAKMQPEIL
ncbi:unnamed protein product [Rodentolepis nana]|uniref:tRNA (32-2'-O)-methyltransferase regulator THADA-like C-terminal TPR repeats region domain-containing protein n=1 Tax=Rodentolepis nana TaxID=102285 RepID=A0A3P7VGR1_RODNA|nr:unnamed protein product [Rodentolepis nana]